MKVAKIQIQNILGIENLEILPGKVTKIEGRNGSGKTSALEAIKAALKGGHQAELLRKGADVGEIVLVLDSGARIIKTVTATESNTKVTNENGKMSKPMQFIGQLSDEISLNPIKFLECKPADRADFLLEAMPLEANITEISEIIAPALSGQKVDVPKGHALKSVDSVYDQLFQHRQDINRTLKEKTATIDQLTATLPEDKEAKDFKKELADMSVESNAKKDALREAQTKMERQNKTNREGVDAETRRYLDKARAEYDKVVEKTKAAYNTACETIKADERKQIDGEEARFKKEWDETSDGLKQEIAAIDGRVLVLKEKADAQIKAESQREIVAGMNAEAGKLKDKSKAHTDVLEGLKAYKDVLLKNLPIAGISIENGKIFKEGIPFDTLNTASQVQIAVDLAKIRAKELGLIVLDGCENLDSEHLQALEEAISKTDLQMVITAVTDGELSVTTK